MLKYLVISLLDRLWPAFNFLTFHVFERDPTLDPSPPPPDNSILIVVTHDIISYCHGPKPIIEYRRFQNGCIKTVNLWFKNEQRWMENVDFVTVFCEDFWKFADQEEVLDNLNLKFSGDYEMERFSAKFLEKFRHILVSRPPLKTRRVRLEVFNEENLMSILPYLDSEALETIFIIDALRRMKKLEIDKLVVLDQWKKAEELEIQSFSVDSGEDMNNFRHFKKVLVDFKSV
ncbi:hypothetical protein GCK72_021360 [Caenorhabditis remanei]|uniref:DUF38 domain-containing protein n=1 Tax=Caenorhabditis remanei TaxID=31234 RepID=A0A6A5GJK8_CAERE|nr:hypothetical protein GCK72_021360 [Caenorhabditis remanei]KAF1754796.1 hypothetical protein GCK72_021360 [Caenorhabditis remanei]